MHPHYILLTGLWPFMKFRILAAALIDFKMGSNRWDESSIHDWHLCHCKSWSDGWRELNCGCFKRLERVARSDLLTFDLRLIRFLSITDRKVKGVSLQLRLMS